MASDIRYRGRTIIAEEIAFIGKLIVENPTASRRTLSTKLCEAWNWVQANGAPRDMVCRGLMLKLHRAGLIALPAKQHSPPNPLARRGRRSAVSASRSFPLLAGLGSTGGVFEKAIEGKLSEIRPLQIRQVRRSPEEKHFEHLLETHHYVGYTQPVGEHLKYLVSARAQPVACLAWSSAPRHLMPRDAYIGWSPEARRSNIHLIAYNLRFLILPWVKVPHLASHLLGQMAKVVPRDWQRIYNHPIYFLETFVDPERFRGTSYRAANWVCLGRTTGRGKDDVKDRGPNRSVKEVWGYPLTPDFRERLCAM